MPLPPRLFPGDEELGKRDDDHRPGTKRPLGMAWQQRQVLYGLHRRTIRRIALAIVALLALYFFFRNMPTDLQNPRPRPHYDHSASHRPPMSGSKASPSVNQDSMPSNGRKGHTEQSPHNFNGPIKFYELATTLRAAKRYRGSDVVNRNVVRLSDSFLSPFLSC
jgi:hypothetical protein